MSSDQTMSACKPRQLPRNAGLGLVEIMVALVIGLVATLVITQALTVFEGQKRTTTGNADAQTNGSMALFDIKRHMEMAGYGIPIFSVANSPLKNCATLPTFNHDGDATTAAIDIFPVVITDGGTGSDRIAIRYGRIQTAGIPISVTVSAAGSEGLALVTNNMGCQAEDWAVISSVNGCAMVKVATTLLPLSDPARVLTGGIPLTTLPSVTEGSIACIGRYQKEVPYDDHSSPLEYLYWIDNGQLVQGGNPATPGSGAPSGTGIVNIQAQYGISAVSTDNFITQWVNATGVWVTPALANRNRIKAVRIAIVARNGQMEKTSVTTACSSTTGANPTGLCAWDATSAAPTTASPAPSIDLSADTDWQRYRYRVFETIIPLRSMIWSK